MKLDFCPVLRLTLLSSCTNNDYFENQITPSSLERIQEDNSPLTFDGSVKSWINENKELIAFTETKTHKHIFVMQNVSNSKVMNNMGEDFDKLVFLEHGFSLKTKSGNSFLMQIKNNSKSIKAIETLKYTLSQSDIKLVEGSGIVHIWLSKESYSNVNYESLRLQKRMFEPLNPIFSDNSDCDSGGTGSNSCSTNSSFDGSIAGTGGGISSGCSVSCGGGYYSCCSNASLNSSASCSCIQEQQ